MNHVKIFAIPVLGNSSDYVLSKLFARSPFFMIFNQVTDEKKFLKNDFTEEKTETGISIAHKLIANGVNVFCGIDIGINVIEIANENSVQVVLLANENAKGNSIISLINRRNH